MDGITGQCGLILAHMHVVWDDFIDDADNFDTYMLLVVVID